MKKTLLGCAGVLMFAAAPLWSSVASAQDLPKLSEFLSKCARDNALCRTKVKDFVTASVTQKSICLPKDVAIYDAVGETLRWLRSSETRPAGLSDVPYDDALYEATTKLYPCAPPPEPTPPLPPPVEPPVEPPAAPPVEPPAVPPAPPQ